ncbi:MAG: cytochrome c [Nitrospirota bacterium]|nr:cytochrome c [Nitrospirota bacterium]
MPISHFYRTLPPAALLAAVLLSGAACNKSTSPPPELAHSADAPATAVPASSSTDATGGEKLFLDHCARCHGERGVGTNQGPPLVHKIYEPNHHPDAAFYRAAAQGVRAHHWQFGDMPAVGADHDQVTAIIGYVRALQREAGIF